MNILGKIQFMCSSRGKYQELSQNVCDDKRKKLLFQPLSLQRSSSLLHDLAYAHHVGNILYENDVRTCLFSSFNETIFNQQFADSVLLSPQQLLTFSPTLPSSSFSLHLSDQTSPLFFFFFLLFNRSDLLTLIDIVVE